jgi:hypothetical protein
LYILTTVKVRKLNKEIMNTNVVYYTYTAEMSELVERARQIAVENNQGVANVDCLVVALTSFPNRAKGALVEIVTGMADTTVEKVGEMARVNITGGSAKITRDKVAFDEQANLILEAVTGKAAIDAKNQESVTASELHLLEALAEEPKGKDPEKRNYLAGLFEINNISLEKVREAIRNQRHSAGFNKSLAGYCMLLLYLSREPFFINASEQTRTRICELVLDLFKMLAENTIDPRDGQTLGELIMRMLETTDNGNILKLSPPVLIRCYGDVTTVSRMLEEAVNRFKNGTREADRLAASWYAINPGKIFKRLIEIDVPNKINEFAVT